MLLISGHHTADRVELHVTSEYFEMLVEYILSHGLVRWED